MDKNDEMKTKEIFLDIGRKLCGIIGWREAIGHVYFLLYVENKPLSLDDIVSKTNLSKSNIWGIIQQLLRIGAVNKVWLTENRKDFYVAERDFNLILTRGIIPLLKTKVNYLSSCLDNAQKELVAVKKNTAVANDDSLKHYEDMLTELMGQKEKLESFFNIMGM